MYEDIMLLAVSSITSVIIIFYSMISAGKDLENIIKPISPTPLKINRTNFITRKKELEYMKELLQGIIARIYKECEENKISEDEKNVLVERFRKKLLEVDNEINEVSLYAELEGLEKEYKNLLNEYEKRRKNLEIRIGKIKDKIKLKKGEEEKIVEEKEVSKPKAPAKSRVGRESDFTSLMKELSEMMKRLEEGEE